MGGDAQLYRLELIAHAVEAALVSRLGCSRRYRYCRVLIDAAHCGGLCIPVIRIVLNNAAGIYPQIPKANSPSDDNGMDERI